jgi:hypothetical protein
MTSIQPELWVDAPGEALAFYEAAFGATVLHRVGEGEDIVAQLGVSDAAFWVARNRRRHWPDASGGRESRRGCSPGGGRRRDAIVSRARRARLAPRSDHRPLRPRMGDRRASGNLATALSGLWRRPDGEGG